ncbi:sedoheptulose 7-phosphate cyclase [Massilia sp. TSP1-1-2]|uniref:sedoheptulose 7-phosphate cyclase n=1 Tax=Massilia sp. TSP1-1-2 TaxID=2804649 RepID=UPI003CEFD7CD
MQTGVHHIDGTFHSRAAAEWRYSVDMTEGVFDPDNELLAGYCEGRQVLVFSSGVVDSLYGEAVRAYFAAHLPEGSWQYVVLPTGEHNKNLRSVEAICEHAKQARIDRHGLLVAVGGGIVCDIVGFAASIYKRGIGFIKVNTTLVGQIDVGVGIKTGVNFLASKNMVGTYYPAHASINDPRLLQSLPARQISCGLAEIIKMAIIVSAELFELLEVHVASIRARRFADGSVQDGQRDLKVLTMAIRLMMDELCPNLQERELARLVDFGHSFSPMMEIESDHQLHHGEAVAIDMALSARIAVRLGLLSEADCARILALLVASGLPVYHAATCSAALLGEALRDMVLHRGGRVNLVVPTGLGCADFIRHSEALPAELVAAAADDLRRYCNTRAALSEEDVHALA